MWINDFYIFFCVCKIIENFFYVIAILKIVQMPLKIETETFLQVALYMEIPYFFSYQIALCLFLISGDYCNWGQVSYFVNTCRVFKSTKDLPIWNIILNLHWSLTHLWL